MKLFKQFFILALVTLPILSMAQDKNGVLIAKIEQEQCQIMVDKEQLDRFVERNNEFNKYEITEYLAYAEVFEGKTTYYLHGKGSNGEANVVVRFELNKIGIGLYLNPSRMIGESCSAVCCTKCSFRLGGGCDCKTSCPSGDGYCNHSTSKTGQE